MAVPQTTNVNDITTVISALASRQASRPKGKPLTGPQRAATTSCNAANCPASRIGLVKNEPALRVSGSAGSSTMPLPHRSASTAARTSPSGACPPSATPSRCASSR